MPLTAVVPRWKPGASLEDISNVSRSAGQRAVADIDRDLAAGGIDQTRSPEADADEGLAGELRGRDPEGLRSFAATAPLLERTGDLATDSMGTLIYLQGVAALRRGENDNCIMCRGESSCILPISPAAVHTNPAGSRLAIKHFTEYLEQFPDDLEVRWLLNLAHMTLGEYPDEVDPRFRLDLCRLLPFRVRHRQVPRRRPARRRQPLQPGRRCDHGRFRQRRSARHRCQLARPDTAPVLLPEQGGFERSRTVAGRPESPASLAASSATRPTTTTTVAWMSSCRAARGCAVAIRPSLLRNNGTGGFTDVTREAGLLDPLNSNAAAWADYDNDGRVDLFIGCEQQTNRLYHNKGNGTFEEVAARAGVQGSSDASARDAPGSTTTTTVIPTCFSIIWPRSAALPQQPQRHLHATSPLDGHRRAYHGFSCWAWDYDNDGWLDIFATCYDRTLADVVKGMLGKPHGRYSNRLFRNRQGKGFEDVTEEAGLDMVFATMGSNFGDFDNDGFLDMYLGTGEPSIATLVPNRMFKNVGGERFSEITASSGTGHLQKGHGVACGDWDRDGDVDLFVETGGAVNGDRYHNVLFQNPGQGNHWLT